MIYIPFNVFRCDMCRATTVLFSGFLLNGPFHVRRFSCYDSHLDNGHKPPWRGCPPLLALMEHAVLDHHAMIARIPELELLDNTNRLADRVEEVCRDSSDIAECFNIDDQASVVRHAD
jgi:hypothetical protein